MPISVLRGKTDEIIDQIVEALKRYESQHPAAEIDLYRQNAVSVRVRIVDPVFTKMSKRERNDLVWRFLDSLSEDVQGDISMLVLLAPAEKDKSFANIEFEDPVPSSL